MSGLALTAEPVQDGRYYQGVARRNGALICTCGHPGHLHRDDALDCVTAMARGLRAERCDWR